MKKLLLLSISVLFLNITFIGCKKENNDYKAQDLYGTWQVTHFISPDTNDWFEWDYTAKDTMFIELRKNGTWYWNSNPAGTYELKGNTLYTEISDLFDDKISPIKCEIQKLDLKKGTIEVDVYLPMDISGMESAELNHIYSAKLKRIP